MGFLGQSWLSQQSCVNGPALVSLGCAVTSWKQPVGRVASCKCSGGSQSISQGGRSSVRYSLLARAPVQPPADASTLEHSWQCKVPEACDGQPVLSPQPGYDRLVQRRVVIATSVWLPGTNTPFLSIPKIN